MKGAFRVSAALLATGALSLRLAAPWAQEAAGTDIETVMRGVQHREAALRTVRGYLVEANYFPTPGPDRTLFQVRFVLADGRMRYAAAAISGGTNHWLIVSPVEGPMVRLPGLPASLPGEPPRTEVAEDGQLRVTYHNTMAAAEVSAQETAPSVAERDPFSELLMFGNGIQTWGQMLEEAWGRRPGGPVAVTTEADDESRCQVLTIPLGQEDGGEDWVVKLWVNPDMGYAVVRAQSTAVDRASGALTRALVYEGVDFREAGDGIWLPRETMLYSFRYDLGRDNPCNWITRTVFSGLEANSAVSDADFAIDIPIGARITSAAGLDLSPGRRDSDATVRTLREADAPEPHPPLRP